MNPNIQETIAKMPKAELHLHLEGTPQWSSIRQALAKHYGQELPDIPDFYHPDFKFRDFQEFLDTFVAYIHPWLRTSNGYAEFIDAAVEHIIQQNICYVELNFSIFNIQRMGHQLELVLSLLAQAVEKAESQGCIIKLIAGISRNQSPELASQWVKKLLKYPMISGFDLHGLETPETHADLFGEAFTPAREAGKKIKTHAGEMAGSESIRAAVEKLGVNQIGHGTSAIKDADLVQLLIDRKVVVEMCPTSNQRLRNIPSYHQHPIVALDAAGVTVTVNSDDPSLFGVNLTDEMIRLITERNVAISDLIRWTRNAFNCALVNAETRASLHTQLDSWQQEFINIIH